MTDKKIEERLNAAVRSETPDILEDLVAELRTADEKPAKTVNPAPYRKGRKKRILALVASMALIVCGFSILNSIRSQEELFAVIDLDVNPGIELSINKDEKVISASPVNEEGKEILNDMDLTGSDVNVACNAIVGAMYRDGYLSNRSNSILVSVRTTDEDRGRQIEKALSESLSTSLEGELSPAVLGQYVQEDKELKVIAKKYGISEGKAWLIRSLLESGSVNMTFKSLSVLTTQELILLGFQQEIQGDARYGQADTCKYIGDDEAADIALRSAGTHRQQVSGLTVRYDCKDGSIIYEVGFSLDNVTYRYDIDAVTGAILDMDKAINTER